MINVSGQPQIEATNLKVLSDQLNYESLLNKKYNLYSEYCSDSELKHLCCDAANIHKQNFISLKTYLDSHS